MQKKKTYVLVLPSWYPSKVHAFNGDFNERTVDALSLEVDQIVLYVVKKEKGWRIDTTWSHTENLITCKVYYPALNLPVIGKYISVICYYILTQYYIRKIISRYGLPSLVHMYVILYAGILAPWIKKRYRLRIVMTEHWTAFYDYAAHNLYQYPALVQKLIKKLYKSVDHLMPVADALARQIKPWAPAVQQTVIPNVVNTSIFSSEISPENQCSGIEKRRKMRFLHVSSMEYQKNPEGILLAFESVLKKGTFAELWLVGPVRASLQTMINNSELLSGAVQVKGEVPYKDVAAYMRKAHCLLMFSRFENLPCVILEALCCGLPVIATDVGGVKEIINPSNGILINSEDVKALEAAITSIVNNYDQYKMQKISKDAIENYNYSSIAKRISKIYNEVSLI